VIIEVRNGNVDRAIKVLKRKLADDGMFRKLQEKQAYEKPSEKRRRVKRAGIVRQRKADAERKVLING
jgi:small subunit ribosomal protein S21